MDKRMAWLIEARPGLVIMKPRSQLKQLLHGYYLCYDAGATRMEPQTVRVDVVLFHDRRTLPGISLSEAFAGDVRNNVPYCNFSFGLSQRCMNDYL